MECLKRIFKTISEIKQDNPTNDNVSIGEQIVIHLVKNGHTIKTMNPVAHTWLGAGCGEIAKWLAGVSAIAPTSIGFESSNILAGKSVTSTSIAVWQGTFSSIGALSGRYFYLTGAGVTYSSFDCGITFTKSDGIEMQIRWESTISGV